LRCSMSQKARLRASANKPNRSDRLGKAGVHQ
jgi:hypothetical protein